VLRLIIGTVLAIGLAGSALADTWVEGHIRANGTYAPGHFRRERDPYAGDSLRLPSHPWRIPRPRGESSYRGGGARDPSDQSVRDLPAFPGSSYGVRPKRPNDPFASSY
jgi:hypothetical protein